MKYRIVKETDNDSYSHFHVQYKSLFWWSYCCFFMNLKEEFGTSEKASEFIIKEETKRIDEIKKKYGNKIIKREYINVELKGYDAI